MESDVSLVIKKENIFKRMDSSKECGVVMCGVVQKDVVEKLKEELFILVFLNVPNVLNQWISLSMKKSLDLLQIRLKKLLNWIRFMMVAIYLFSSLLYINTEAIIVHFVNKIIYGMCFIVLYVRIPVPKQPMTPPNIINKIAKNF